MLFCRKCKPFLSQLFFFFCSIRRHLLTSDSQQLNSFPTAPILDFAKASQLLYWINESSCYMIVCLNFAGSFCSTSSLINSVTFICFPETSFGEHKNWEKPTTQTYFKSNSQRFWLSYFFNQTVFVKHLKTIVSLLSTKIISDTFATIPCNGQTTYSKVRFFLAEKRVCYPLPQNETSVLNR